MPTSPKLHRLGPRAPCHNEMERRRTGGHRKGSYRKRGYSARWDAHAEIMKAKHPVCEVAGCLEPTAEVHHVHPVSMGGEVMVDEDHLICVCRDHHEVVERVAKSGVWGKAEQLSACRR